MNLQNTITMKFKTDEVLGRLKINQEKHDQEYKEALEGYVEEVHEKLKLARKKVTTAIKAASEGKVEISDLGFHDVHHLPKPRSYSKEYARVISMLEATCDESIELTSSEFDRFMNDNWEWKEAFTTSNALYLKG